MNKSTLILLLAVFAVLLVACQKAPEAAQGGAMQKEEAPSATIAPAPAEPTASEGKIKLTKFTATKSGTTATVLFGLENLETTSTTATIKVTLFYARQPVADQELTVTLGPSEKKDFTVAFENYPEFSSFYVDSTQLVNPLNK